MGDEVDVEVLDVDLTKERISLSLKATQTDPWQEFANSHQVGELVYGRITKLVPFGAFVQVGDGIEGLVHISEMAGHHVDLPEQVVTPGEELWVKIIDIDLQRRRISLSIKQAAEGGEVSEEYREAFGEHAYDEQGNYIGPGFAEPSSRPRPRPRRPGPTTSPSTGPARVAEMPAGEAPAAAEAATGAARRAAAARRVAGPPHPRPRPRPLPPQAVTPADRASRSADRPHIRIAAAAGRSVHRIGTGGASRPSGRTEPATRTSSFSSSSSIGRSCPVPSPWLTGRPAPGRWIPPMPGAVVTGAGAARGGPPRGVRG